MNKNLLYRSGRDFLEGKFFIFALSFSLEADVSSFSFVT